MKEEFKAGRDICAKQFTQTYEGETPQHTVHLKTSNTIRYFFIISWWIKYMAVHEYQAHFM